MRNNPFVWFLIKFIKLKPIIYSIIYITSIILSIYIKDFFILLFSLIYIVFQVNIEMIISYFLTPKNYTIFLTPFSPRSFIQQQSNAVCLKSLVPIEIGLIINMLIQHYSFFEIISFSILTALFAYSFCLFIFSTIATLSVKLRKISISIIIGIVIFLTILIKVLSNEYIALIIMGIILFVFSHLSFKKLSFEKILGVK